MPYEEATSLPPYYLVTQEPLALLLLSEVSLGQLEPFTVGPRTLADLARDLEEPIYKVRRWALRLVRAGVLEVKHIEKRKGRPIQHYGLTHTDFFIPTDVVTIQEFLELIESSVNAQINSSLARELTEAQKIGGYHVHLEPNNSGVVMAYTPFQRWQPTKHENVAFHMNWAALNLNHEQAVQLQNELTEVIAKYHKFNGPQEYLIALKMVAAWV